MLFAELCNELADLPQVEALALGGSRAGSDFDEKSDFDLYVYCTSVPQSEVRRAILEKYCSYIELGNSFWELEDDCTFKDGVDIDILYRNLDGFTADVASVVEGHCAHNGYTTCMWHNLVNCKILLDKNGRLAAAQQRFDVTYPHELAKNIVRQNFRLLTNNLPSYDGQIKKALSRGDLVSVNHRTAAFLESYFDIVFAMNKLTHPGEKRMASYALSHCDCLPVDFEKNLNRLFADMFIDAAATEYDLQRIIEALTQTRAFINCSI